MEIMFFIISSVIDFIGLVLIIWLMLLVYKAKLLTRENNQEIAGIDKRMACQDKMIDQQNVTINRLADLLSTVIGKR